MTIRPKIRTRILEAGVLAVGFVIAAAAPAAPAAADTTSDSFLSALSNAGINTSNPTDTVALGQSICPMLVEPGKSFASVASNVGLTRGLSPEMASFFTGIAISMYCPSMVSSIGDGTFLNALNGLGGAGGLNGLNGLGGLGGLNGLSIPSI
jgi:hypothetical protein